MIGYKAGAMAQSKVYFTKTVSPEAMLKMFEALTIELPGKVAVKVHSGEMGNQNFIRPAFLKLVLDKVQGTIVECNTAYPGSRFTSDVHWETMKQHEWTDYFPVDILDEDGEIELPVQGGNRLQSNIVGSHLDNYDSLLVLSHFKGHQMGGFGGALKNVAIGLASSRGKSLIHSGGDPEANWMAGEVEQDHFLECMADANKSVLDHFNGQVAFVNAMMNISIDCDCNGAAAPPKIADIGILSSLDPVALDQACLDLVYALDDPEKADLIERIESLNGPHILEAAAAIGVGNKEYELVSLD